MAPDNFCIWFAIVTHFWESAVPNNCSAETGDNNYNVWWGGPVRRLCLPPEE